MKIFVTFFWKINYFQRITMQHSIIIFWGKSAYSFISVRQKFLIVVFGAKTKNCSGKWLVKIESNENNFLSFVLNQDISSSAKCVCKIQKISHSFDFDIFMCRVWDTILLHWILWLFCDGNKISLKETKRKF